MTKTAGSISLAATHAWLAEGIEAALAPALRNDALSLRYLKAICEIAFFVSSHPERYPAKLTAAVDRCLDFVWGGGQLLALARHNVQHANLWLPLLYACGKRLALGRRSNADIRLIANVSLAHTKERIPFRAVDLHHACWRLTGSPKALAQMRAAARHGCLRAGASVASIAPADAYAITHTIFYCTDFGKLPWLVHLAPMTDVDEILSFLTWHPENQDNFDLRGEFLLARRCLGIGADRTDGEIAAIEQGRRQDGSWPGPVDLQPVLRDEKIPQEYWPFFADYHTTLVCAEALAACRPDLSPVAGPGQALPARRRQAAGVSNVLTPSSTVAGLMRAYRRLGQGVDTASPDDALDAPETIVHAVEGHLIRRMMLGGSSRAAAIKSLATIDAARAWADPRLARVVLSAGVAVAGKQALRSRRVELKAFLRQVRGKTAISVDEACILAMAFQDASARERPMVCSMLDAVVNRLIGRCDIVAAVHVATFARLFIDGRYDRQLDAFMRSYMARSVPFGFVVADDDRSCLAASRLALALLQFKCVRHLSRRSLPASGLLRAIRRAGRASQLHAAGS